MRRMLGHGSRHVRGDKGQVLTLGSVHSRHEDVERTVRVYLPASYRDEPSRRFPVLYLHDGQNLFDGGERGPSEAWGVDSTLDALTMRGALAPWIVVAVDHRGVHRIGDYSPWPDPRLDFEPSAARYGAFVLDELMPLIDHELRTLPGPVTTAMGGSSLGGLVSLYLAFRHPERIRRVVAMSPSVMWGSRGLFNLWTERRPARLYLDVGAREMFAAGTFGLDFDLDYGSEVPAFAAHLRQLGHGPDELLFVVDPDGEHHEWSWRRRLPAALAWSLA